MDSAVPYLVFPSFAAMTVTMDYICKQNIKQIHY